MLFMKPYLIYLEGHGTQVALLFCLVLFFNLIFLCLVSTRKKRGIFALHDYIGFGMIMGQGPIWTVFDSLSETASALVATVMNI